jgi:hypothetical protein
VFLNCGVPAFSAAGSGNRRNRGADEPTLRSARDARLAELDDDFAFVAERNIGGEFMVPEKIARLQRIAGVAWQHTLEDRLDLSWEESAWLPQTRESCPRRICVAALLSAMPLK